MNTFQLMLAGAVGLFLVSHNGFADDNSSDRRTVTVVGEAEIEVAPDKAILDLTVTTEDNDLTKAKAAQDKKIQTLSTIAKELSIPEKNIRTTYSYISPRYDYLPNSSRVFVAYTVQQSLTIEIDKADDAAKLVNALVERGFENVGNIRFEVSKERELREEALLKAVENGRGKAQKLAETLGMKLGKPVAVVESGPNMIMPPYPMPMMAKMEMAGAPAMAMDNAGGGVMPGMAKIQQNVHVSFELE